MLESLSFGRVRAALTDYDLVAAMLLRATAVVTIVCAASLVTWQILVASDPRFAGFSLGAGHLEMSGFGAVLGGAGFLACSVLEGRGYVRAWLAYVYACSFLAFSFVLLTEWFEVRGATGLWL